MPPHGHGGSAPHYDPLWRSHSTIEFMLTYPILMTSFIEGGLLHQGSVIQHIRRCQKSSLELKLQSALGCLIGHGSQLTLVCNG